jgi:hypothetical protein
MSATTTTIAEDTSGQSRRDGSVVSGGNGSVGRG